MKLSLCLLLFVCGLLVHIQAEAGKCLNREACDSTNYQSYVDCVHRRLKRATDCDSSCSGDNCIDTCGDCDCSSCNYSNCDNSCNSCCSSCCNNYIPCRTNHCCHKTCQAQCQSSGCRSVCRKNCFDTVKQVEEIPYRPSTSNTSSALINENRHNVTTVIHLNNVINNTNIIDVPISINYTNQNNLTLHGGDLNLTQSGSTNNCCIVISPRRCVPVKEFPFVRCFHYRSRQCGHYCTASIVHKEERQICQSIYPGVQSNCQQQVIYIPQPQPRCYYQSTWPYVSCGIQRSTSCSGCYNHYVNEDSKAHLTCPSGCYDDGFGAGSYYRQGPMYRPSYSHTPCDSFGAVGGCGGYPGYGGFGGNGGYGGYGGWAGYGGSGGYGGVGGYPAAGLGFAPPQLPDLPYGSWSPGEVNSFANSSEFNPNGTYVPFDPLISVGPSFSNPSGYVDPFRASREVEIEVNYEPPSSAQAEVKIQQETETKGKESKKIDKASTVSGGTKKLS